jgi:hypothetical protein
VAFRGKTWSFIRVADPDPYKFELLDPYLDTGVKIALYNHIFNLCKNVPFDIVKITTNAGKKKIVASKNS